MTAHGRSLAEGIMSPQYLCSLLPVARTKLVCNSCSYKAMAATLWKEASSIYLPPQSSLPSMGPAQLSLPAREDSTVGRVGAVCPLAQLGALLFSTLGAWGAPTLPECSASSPEVPHTWISCCHHTIKGPLKPALSDSPVPSCAVRD